MMDAVWRLAWALPLVLALGVAAVLMLRRFTAPAGTASLTGQRLSLRESLSISDDTRLHLIEVDGKAHVIIESERQTVLQWAQAGEAPRAPVAFGPRWVQRLHQAGPR